MHSIKVASKNSYWQNRKLILGAFLCCVLSIFILWRVFNPSGVGMVRTAKVKRGDLYQRVTVSGSVVSNKLTPISTPFDGYIQKIYVKVGDKVKVNDPIVTVTESLLNADKAYPIRAPFAGTVVQVEHSEGEFVRGGTEGLIVRIDDLSQLFIASQVAEVDITKMRVGMETSIRISALGDTEFRGVVEEIAMAAKSPDGWRAKQSTFDLRVKILNLDDRLRPGMSAVMDVVTNSYPNVLYLPLEYIYQEGDANYVVDRRGRRRPVEVGNQTEMASEIKSGLSEGDEVQLVDFLKLLESGS